MKNSNMTNLQIIEKLESAALNGNITATVILIHFASQINPYRLREVLDRRRVLPGDPGPNLPANPNHPTESFLFQ